MRLLTRCLILCVVVLWAAGCAESETPRLLLSPQRLKRLQRERERQTERWSYFEKRVLTALDSPERGFELALYYAVTGDDAQGKAAVAWALAHPCERRQAALVASWADSAAGDAERDKLLHLECPTQPAQGQFQNMRDHLFWQILRHEEPQAGNVDLESVPTAEELYALVEYLDVYHATQAEDLRRQNAPLYLKLPAAYLLSMQPQELDHPTWQQHVAALALVQLDPNMQGSQFLQGWALEDRFTIHSGPGVAYDFLWANAYLPGVGYQNLDPWVYWESKAQFWARTDWNADACWIHISASGSTQQNCPAGWQRRTMQFGALRLVPVTERCVSLPEKERGHSLLLHVSPGARISYLEEKEKRQSKADSAGFWIVPENITAQVCVLPDSR